MRAPFPKVHSLDKAGSPLDMAARPYTLVPNGGGKVIIALHCLFLTAKRFVLSGARGAPEYGRPALVCFAVWRYGDQGLVFILPRLTTICGRTGSANGNGQGRPARMQIGPEAYNLPLAQRRVLVACAERRVTWLIHHNTSPCRRRRRHRRCQGRPTRLQRFLRLSSLGRELSCPC